MEKDFILDVWRPPSDPKDRERFDAEFNQSMQILNGFKEPEKQTLWLYEKIKKLEEASRENSKAIQGLDMKFRKFEQTLYGQDNSYGGWNKADEGGYRDNRGGSHYKSRGGYQGKRGSYRGEKY